MWNLKFDTNELIHEIETNSETQRTDSMSVRNKLTDIEARKREGWAGWEMSEVDEGDQNV